MSWVTRTASTVIVDNGARKWRIAMPAGSGAMEFLIAFRENACEHIVTADATGLRLRPDAPRGCAMAWDGQRLYEQKL
jgi:hypothetical protein